jgi:hypothetical protein
MSRCNYAIVNFDLWICKGTHDLFPLVINFWKVDYQLEHIVIGLFETTGTIGQALARNFIQLLDQKNLAYVKYEGSNLNIMTIIQKSVVSCENVGLK